MNSCYYELTVAPDFTLSKYATLSETGPSGVLTQHQAFWRQLNQWGKLFHGSIHLIYEYDPSRSRGQRLKMVMRFDVPDCDAEDCVRHIMQASVLAPYYDRMVEVAESCLSMRKYRWSTNLAKKERIITATDSGEDNYFYTTSEWSMNEEARLYSMLRMMASFNCPCAYCVDIYPVDYSQKMEEGLSHTMSYLRDLTSFKVNKTDKNSIRSGGRDENAKKALDFYEELLENLIESPHFLVNIQVLGDSIPVTKQLLDAAACEALSEGNHNLICEELEGNIDQATVGGILSYSSKRAPKQLEDITNLLTLEQLVPFAVLPVLYPGETIEMPKETVPKTQKGLLLGVDEHQHEIMFPWKKLAKHAFLAGMPGSGKTNTMMYLISELHKAGITVLVMEPAKKEYRVLTTLPEMKDISLFSPCANSTFPIHINPFEFPRGMKLADHINRLLDVFNGTFQLDPPMPMLLVEGIQKCYEEMMWLPGMINTGDLEYPTMRMLYNQIERLLERYQYSEEVKSNLKSVLQVRIGSLLSREMGDIFDVKESTFPPEMWLKKSAVIELASLGTGPSNFMMLMLMTLIRETLDVQPYNPEDYNGAPRHVIFLEEAHNLIANTSEQQPGGLDPKISATDFITKMLAEVRALGEGIVIADQLPTAMAPEVVKNTSLKIGLRLTSQDERELLGATMSADGVQLERMGIFTPGRCLVSYEDLLKPFEMQIPEFKGDAAVSDEELLLSAICNPTYQENMHRSALILLKKFEEKNNELVDDGILKIFKSIKQKKKELEASKIAEEQYQKSFASQIDKLTRELKVLGEKYEDVMKELGRLCMDMLIYMGITVIRDRYLERMGDITEDEYLATKKMHRQWMDLIEKQYVSICDFRNRIKVAAKQLELSDLSDYEKILGKQEQLIRKSWQN